MPKTETLEGLETALAYSFSDKSLLERALTHRSWAHEELGPGEEISARQLHNEAMEFLGDSVLGLVVAEYLLRSNPELNEGELSRMKHRLVSATTLCRAAKDLSLGKHLRFGRGEEKTGGRRKAALLADSYEAVLAAIYLDGGFKAAEQFVHRSLREELEGANPEDAAAADTKTALQERLQAAGLNAPHYEVIETSGPPHRRTFHIEATWEGGKVRGEGQSRKAAEMQAALRAITQLDSETETAPAA